LAELEASLRLGAAIDGTQDELVVVARRLASDYNVFGNLVWREI
jgi:hypothetical protein